MKILNEFRSVVFSTDMSKGMQDHEEIIDGLENDLYGIDGVHEVRHRCNDFQIEIVTVEYLADVIDEEAARIWNEVVKVYESWEGKLIM